MTPAPAAYALAGEVDASTAPLHLERLQAMIGTSATSAVVVELAQTRLVDTTGLGMLIDARQSASVAGKRLVLRSANPARAVDGDRGHLRAVRLGTVMDRWPCGSDKTWESDS